MTHASRFRAPSIPIESTASTWAGMATRECYLATSVDQPGDAVVHQVRSRGRKAPAKRQVKSSAARKTHGASTGLALGLISGFGTKLTCLRVHACRLMRAKRTRSEHRQTDAKDPERTLQTTNMGVGSSNHFGRAILGHCWALQCRLSRCARLSCKIVSFGPATLSRIATGCSPVLRCNFWNMARKQFGSGVLWCCNVLSRRAICTIGDICDFPSSPKGAIKIDEICRDLRVTVGKIIFALQQLGLCRDDI
jgi:hypothetical protein